MKPIYPKILQTALAMAANKPDDLRIVAARPWTVARVAAAVFRRSINGSEGGDHLFRYSCGCPVIVSWIQPLTHVPLETPDTGCLTHMLASAASGTRWRVCADIPASGRATGAIFASSGLQPPHRLRLRRGFERPAVRLEAHRGMMGDREPDSKWAAKSLSF
jgi:hypothetical protein